MVTFSATSAGPLAISQSIISPLLSANWAISLGLERLWVRRWYSAMKSLLRISFEPCSSE